MFGFKIVVLGILIWYELNSNMNERVLYSNDITVL